MGYLMLMISIFLIFNSSLSKIFDYMMNNFFIIIYFPNIAIYLAAIIATNIILFVSIFSNKTSKVIKNINIIVYTIINYLLVLLLFTVNKSGLDLFSQSSIYQNQNATALIELTSILFIIWVIFLVLYKVILSYLRKGEEMSEDTARIRRKIIMEEQTKIFREKEQLEKEKEAVKSEIDVYKDKIEDVSESRMLKNLFGINTISTNFILGTKQNINSFNRFLFSREQYQFLNNCLKWQLFLLLYLIVL